MGSKEILLLNGCQILLENKIPVNFEGVIFDYHYAVSSGNNCHYDPREIISLKQDKWLKSILNWHATLSKKTAIKTEFWPLSHGSRIINWSTVSDFNLKPLLFSASILDYLNTHKTKLILIKNCPREVKAILGENAISNNIKTSFLKKCEQTCFTLKAECNFWINLFRQALACFIKIRALDAPISRGSYELIVFTQLINSEIVNNEGDHYFGRNFDKIRDAQDKVFWVYSDFKFEKLKEIASSLNREQCFLFENITFSILFSSIIEAISFKKIINVELKEMPIIEIDGIKYNSFTRKFSDKLILEQPIIVELVANKIIKKFFKFMEAKSVIYPYEEKPIERSLLLACKESGENINTIAFAHAAYSDGHLYAYRKQDLIPRPFQIAIVGEIQRKKFEELGWDLSQTLVVGSPRRKNIGAFIKGNSNVLLIIGYGFELRNFYNWIDANKALRGIKNYKFIIRKNPHSWVKEQKYYEKKLKNLGVQFTDNNESLNDSLSKVQFVLYESTSAAIESSIAGKLIIKIQISDSLASNHYPENIDTENIIPYCKTADDLVRELNYLHKNQEKINEIIERQQKITMSYYSQFKIDEIIN